MIRCAGSAEASRPHRLESDEVHKITLAAAKMSCAAANV
jgi:hypothetical protein